jgi:hypothetical protein
MASGRVGLARPHGNKTQGGNAMAVDTRKRQKKLERKRAKEKAKRRELARQNAGGMATRLEAASATPIRHCCAMSDVWDEGIGEVLISRRLNNGNVAFSVFLVDMYCLGVKDAFANIVPRDAYQEDLYDKLADRSELIPLVPAAARKLVEGAVRYADDLGFSPHPDYHKAKAIFGDISAASCDEEFRYGKDGKPMFVNGPFDDPARCRHILKTLRDRLGPDGFHYILGNLEEGELRDYLGLSDEDELRLVDEDDGEDEEEPGAMSDACVGRSTLPPPEPCREPVQPKMLTQESNTAPGPNADRLAETSVIGKSWWKFW